MMLAFKLRLLPMMEMFGIYRSLKCIYGCIVKPVQQNVQN